MTETNKQVNINIIGGVLFLLTAFLQLFLKFGAFTTIVNIAGCGLVALTLFNIIKEKKVISIGFLVLAFGQLFRIISCFKYFSYYTESLQWYSNGNTFNFFTVIPDLLVLCAYILATAMTYFLLKEKDNSIKGTAIQCWFAPAVLFALSKVFAIILQLIFTITSKIWWGGYDLVNIFSLFIAAIITIALVLALLSVSKPEFTAPTTQDEHDNDTVYVHKDNIATGTGSPSVKPVSKANGYMDMAVHILLLLFTFGIWLFVWIYKTTDLLNREKSQPHRNPAAQLLLCFVPFYIIYWMYESGKRVDSLAAEKGINSNLSTLCLILAIFFNIVPPILLQDKINEIVMAEDIETVTYNETATPYVPPINTVENTYEEEEIIESEPTEPETYEVSADPFEEIKKFKELLDLGIITEEEFELKKKQLLNL